MTNKFTEKAKNALLGAQEEARAMGHTYIGSEHLLLGLIGETTGIASKILTARRLRADAILNEIRKIVGVGSPSAVGARDMTPRLKKIVERAAAESVRNGQSYIGTEHLLLALLEERDSVACTVLDALGASVSELKNDLHEFFTASVDRSQGELGDRGSKPVKRDGSKTQTSVFSFGRDLTAAARNGRIDPIIGRESETERLIQILVRRQKNNPCLVGQPGVGKTAVVEGLSLLIAEGRVPEALKSKVIVSLDLAAMIAGAKYRGEFEERMKSVMEEVSKNPDIILFVDEIHTIIGAGAAEGAVDAANILKPALARGEMQLIGATTLEEYRAHIEKDSALERRFQAVKVGEPSEKDTVRILEGLRDKYEAHHKVRITDEAISAAVSLSVRYIPDRFLPDKALDLVDEASSRLRIKSEALSPEVLRMEGDLLRIRTEKEEAIAAQDFEGAARLREEEVRVAELYRLEVLEQRSSDRCEIPAVTAEGIAEVVTQWTGIPISHRTDDDRGRLLGLEKTLARSVIGQDAAIEAVARAIRRGRIGLKDPRRPIGSFLFLGDTGVGKTRLARSLTEALFDSEGALIRFDMSEFMEKHSVSKLIGSPPGYVGYGEGGQLTERVRRKPYSVLLFDEIEKAHPDVFHLFLQILDDGILTDSEGRKVDFRNTVVIMTSNAGTDSLSDRRRLGFGSEDDKSEEELFEARRKHALAALSGVFPPEFLNRIDEIIMFRSLSEQDLCAVTELLLEDVRRRVAALGIEVSFDPSVAHKIVSLEKDCGKGARPLRRAVMRLVEDRISDALLLGEIKESDRILMRFESDEMRIERKSG